MAYGGSHLVNVTHERLFAARALCAGWQTLGNPANEDSEGSKPFETDTRGIKRLCELISWSDWHVNCAAQPVQQLKKEL